MSAGKRERARLAKAELWMNVAMSAETWAGYCDMDEQDLKAGKPLRGDDTLVKLAATYDLRPADIGRLCRQLAQEAENRAAKMGYADRWDAEVPE